MPQIKNINAFTGDECSCKDPLTHWKRHSEEPVFYCSEYDCLRNDLVGSYVQRTDDEQWYIIPLCKMHNRANRELSTTDHTIFIAAHQDQNCL